MSINITVHGNPVSLNRETNIISDFDYAKKMEIERRRKLRLEQVLFDLKIFLFSIFFYKFFVSLRIGPSTIKRYCIKYTKSI